MRQYQRRSTAFSGILAAAWLAAASSAQTQPESCLLQDGQQLCCLGTNCGLELVPPFPEARFHCHSVDAAGVQCWDLLLSDDGELFDEGSCNRIPGFSLLLGDNGAAEATSCDDAGDLGAEASLLLDRVGGYNLFRTRIRRTARPRLATESAGAARRDRDASSEDEADDSDDGAASFAEMTTSIELEDWTFRGIGGETPGVRFGWRRQSETGHLFGLSASYQDADPDFGAGSRLITAHLDYGHTLGPIWTWSLGATLSDFSGLVDATQVGAAGLLGFNRYTRRGSVFSGGLVIQYLDDDTRPEALGVAGSGLAYGFPIGRRLTLDIEGYAVSIWEGELVDDSFYTLAGMLSVYATPRFALTLGYRRLEGIADLDSDSYTFGASTRWQ